MLEGYQFKKQIPTARSDVMRKFPILSLFLSGFIVFSSFGSIQAATVTSPVVNSVQKYIGYSLSKHDEGDFIYYTLKDAGIKASSNLSSLYKQGTSISLSDIQPGDVAFFGSSTSNLFATGIYLGNNRIAIAYKPYGKVKEFSTSDSIVQKNFMGLRRYTTTTEQPSKDPVPEKPSKDPVKENPSQSDSKTQKALIDAGLKYLGTPYEYGSSRDNTKTFDCSDFVRQVYLDGVGLDLGRGGATSQYNYLKKVGAKIKTDWHDLEVGDIMIFMPYRGTSKDAYEKNREQVGHSGIYLGDGVILHTYSKDSGGVRTNKIERHWEYRFIAGGSPIQ